MKKKFRTRIIAGMLTVITMFSTAGAVITPVCAAEVNSNAVKNVSACDVVEMIDKMVDIAVDDSTPMVKLMASGGMEVLKRLCANLFDEEQPGWDPGEQISRSTDEIMTELKTIETNMDAYHNEEMKTLGNIQSMLDEQGDEIKMSTFYTMERDVAADHEYFRNNIAKNEAAINSNLTDTGIKLNDNDTETIKVIDKTTKASYDYIVEHSDITKSFTRMKKYLDKSTCGYESDYFSVIEKIAKRHYDETVDGMITANGEGFGSTEMLKQLPNYDEKVVGLATGYECEALLYYFDCLQIAQLNYQSRNYTAYSDYLNSTSDTRLSDFRAAITLSNNMLESEINSDVETMNSITEAYKSMLSDFNNSKAAEIKITAGGNEYQFTVDDAMRGWMVIDTMTAYDTTEPVTYASFTLDRDWIVKDAENGFIPEGVGINTASAYKTLMEKYDVSPERASNMGHPQLMLPAYRKTDDKQPTRDYAMTFDLNLNGYTLGGKNDVWPELSYINTKQDYTLNINGDPDRNSTLNVDCIEVTDFFSRNNFGLTLNVNDVKLNKVTDSKPFSEALFMFSTLSTDIKTNAHVKNCDITLKGSSALNRYSHENPQWPGTFIQNDTFNMDIVNTTVKNV